jgi:hypothetical protein
LFESIILGRLCQAPGKSVIRPRGVSQNVARRALSDIDGQAEGRASGEQASQTPYKNPRRLARRTPIRKLLVVGKTFLIRPLFPVRDQTSSNRIFSNVVPLFVNRFRCSKETIKTTRLPSPCFTHAIRFIKPALKPFQESNNAQLAFKRRSQQVNVIRHGHYAIGTPLVSPVERFAYRVPS